MRVRASHIKNCHFGDYYYYYAEKKCFHVPVELPHQPVDVKLVVSAAGEQSGVDGEVVVDTAAVCERQHKPER